MADPISMMAVASMATTAIGGVVSAAGAAQKDEATAAMYNYKAGVAKANAQIAEQNAAYAIQTGGLKAQNVGLAGAQKMGQIRAEQAASGIDINRGTASKVRESQQAGIQTAEATTAAAAGKEAYGYRVQGMNFTAEGVLDTSAAQFTKAQETFDVAGSLLGTATSVSDKWFKFNQAGVSGFG